MKYVVGAKEMRRLESAAYKRGFLEADFMENAGKIIAARAEILIAHHRLPSHVYLLVGRGNNGGDAYAAGYHLLLKGFFTVEALAIASSDQCTPLSDKQRRRFEKQGGVVNEIKESSAIRLEKSGLIIDGLFGIGFHGIPEKLYASVIEAVNKTKRVVLSIDIASGLDATSGACNRALVATETCFLALAKTGAFLGEAWQYTGKVHVSNFGLPEDIIAACRADYFLVEKKDFTLPHLVRTRHKYSAGYVVAVAGSPTMPGAAVLSTSAALKMGAGVVRLFHPKGMEELLVMLAAEIIREGYLPFQADRIQEEMRRGQALLVGPGIGTSEQARDLLKELFEKIEKPIIVDAGALNLLASGDIPLPRQALLTPHIGEMHRLLGRHERLMTQDLHTACQDYVNQKKVIILLKGAPTFIFVPEATPYIVVSGDPGMATAGSGDVLTGILASLVAQGKSLAEAACLGALLHGMAGERAAAQKSSYSVTATTLIDFLPEILRDW